ncbi:MHS family MFS transporter [Amycolatopsis acidicola]|uniref:Putative proline/betaine transporter n=1 Tax=Amycolatopsis acidicola TaxID=2596893 RepID=A0A5N0UVA7_9PSEU|nr:MHS family MFS transporter [Amycolatopsis acidicola]
MEAPARERDLARRAALAAFLGSLLEYYDFFIYGSAAALVFSTVFFPPGNPTVSAVLALATFGIAYVARPLGAVVFGHFGDRFGRRGVLLATVLLMGASSLAIGCLPTYDSVGTLAPVLLVICRLVQGLSAGGEAAGASTLTLEYAPEGRRGFFTSFAMSGFAAGMVLATLVFLPVAALPKDDLHAWGWRIPFLLSVFVVAVAYFIRRRLDETPVFTAVEEPAPALPLVTLLREQWRDLLRVIGCSVFAVFQTLFAVFALAFGTSSAVGLDKASLLWVSVVANAVAIPAIPLWALLSDRIGRRPVWVFGALASAITLVAYLWAISTGSMPLVFVMGVLHAGIAYSAVNGLWPSFFTEMFDARVRYTGFAIGTQLGFLLAGFSPSIAVAITGEGSTAWWPVSVFALGCGAISAFAAWTARETHRTPVLELGR